MGREIHERVGNKMDWSGKRGQWFGDSISEQDGKPYSDTGEIAIGYQTLVKRALGFSHLENLAISGRPVANGSANGSGTVSTVLEEYIPSDLVVIAGGTNDYRLDRQIGKIRKEGFDEDTFIGAFQTAIEHIKKTNPNQVIVLMAPLQRDKDGYNCQNPNLIGNYLRDYVRAILEIGNYYDLPVWNGYEKSGVNEANVGQFTYDGLHLNNKGYERACASLIVFLERLNC